MGKSNSNFHFICTISCSSTLRNVSNVNRGETWNSSLNVDGDYKFLYGGNQTVYFISFKSLRSLLLRYGEDIDKYWWGRKTNDTSEIYGKVEVTQKLPLKNNFLSLFEKCLV